MGRYFRGSIGRLKINVVFVKPLFSGAGGSSLWNSTVGMIGSIPHNGNDQIVASSPRETSLGAYRSTKTFGANFRKFPLSNGIVLQCMEDGKCSLG